MPARLALLLAAVVLFAAGCGDDGGATTSGPGTTGPVTTAAMPPTTSPAAELTGLAAVEVAAGLENPVWAGAPPGDERLFVLEQPGRIRLLVAGEVRSEPFLDLTGEVASGALEQGLLALAFHPDYADNGRFFVYYTNLGGDGRLVEYRRSPDPDRADPEPAAVLLAVDQPAGNHNGGTLWFGLDGYLRLSLGDGGGANDQFGHGRRPDTLLGTILRLDVDGGAPYAIPPDNPFAGGGAGLPEVWAYGLRNPWRIDLDPVTGLLYVADVGQRRWEEVNVVPAGAAGLDYGWSLLEGRECFAGGGCDPAGTVLPVVVYGHDEGCSITGGVVYRGSAIPELSGHYFYADYCRGWVRSFRHEGGEAVERADWSADLGDLGSVLSFGTDGAGEMYVLSATGTVYRVDPVRDPG